MFDQRPTSKASPISKQRSVFAQHDMILLSASLQIDKPIQQKWIKERSRFQRNFRAVNEPEAPLMHWMTFHLSKDAEPLYNLEAKTTYTQYMCHNSPFIHPTWVHVDDAHQQIKMEGQVPNQHHLANKPPSFCYQTIGLMKKKSLHQQSKPITPPLNPFCKQCSLRAPSEEAPQWCH